MSLLTELEAHAPEYIEWRHTFHEHPELGLETPWRADLVAAKLRSFGIEVTQGVGGHGVVGVLEGSLWACAQTWMRFRSRKQANARGNLVSRALCTPAVTTDT